MDVTFMPYWKQAETLKWWSGLIFREVSERLMEHAWKACLREIVTRVRIPFSLHMPVWRNEWSWIRIEIIRRPLILDRWRIRNGLRVGNQPFHRHLFCPGDETGRHAALKMLWNRKVHTGSTPVWGTVKEQRQAAFSVGLRLDLFKGRGGCDPEQITTLVL